MSKNNVFVDGLKTDMVKLFPALPISKGKESAGIDVNPRSAWVRGTVSEDIAAVLKAAGFVACGKGYYFVHDCTKLPAFPKVAKAEKTVKKSDKTVEKTVKPEKVYTELSQDVKTRVITEFINRYPGCQIEIVGTWIYISGEKTREYKDALKAEKFVWGKNIVKWCRALTDEEIARASSTDENVAVEPESKPAPAEPAQAQEASRVAEDVQELTALSEIVIRARKGEITREQMIQAMKEVCPF